MAPHRATARFRPQTISGPMRSIRRGNSATGRSRACAAPGPPGLRRPAQPVEDKPPERPAEIVAERVRPAQVVEQAWQHRPLLEIESRMEPPEALAGVVRVDVRPEH